MEGGKNLQATYTPKLTAVMGYHYSQANANSLALKWIESTDYEMNRLRLFK